MRAVPHTWKLYAFSPLEKYILYLCTYYVVMNEFSYQLWSTWCNVLVHNDDVLRSVLCHWLVFLQLTGFRFSQVRVRFEGEDGSGPGVNRGFFAAFANALKSSDKVCLCGPHLQHMEPSHLYPSRWIRQHMVAMWMAIFYFLFICLYYQLCRMSISILFQISMYHDCYRGIVHNEQ